MPPADPAALADAVATVRELGFGHVGFDLPTLCRWTDAVVLLARHFLAILDAGELVRVLKALGSLEVTRTEVLQHETHGHRGIFGKGDGMICVGDVLDARRLAAALEPLLPEVRT